MQNNTPSQPWHKYPFVWLLFGLPLTAVVAGCITFYIAARTDDGVVDDDYYRQGKEINQDLRRDQAGIDSGMRAQVILGEDKRTLRVLLNKPSDAALQIKLMHPTRAGLDQTIKLTPQSPLMWSATLPQALDLKHWQVELGDLPPQWRLRGTWQIRPNQAFVLGEK